MRDPVNGNSGSFETVNIGAMGYFAQITDILPHNVPPQGMILGCVGVIGLIDHQLHQVMWQVIQYFVSFNHVSKIPFLTDI
jgi:hypothetical protein